MEKLTARLLQKKSLSLYPPNSLHLFPASLFLVHTNVFRQKKIENLNNGPCKIFVTITIARLLIDL
jgi:hypothetical protein